VLKCRPSSSRFQFHMFYIEVPKGLRID
jgi:hypothetical protein